MKTGLLNFAVGPVMADDETLKVGGEQVPYFRTADFSAVMLENERIFLALLNADEEARALFLTGSGTASMEAAVMNTLTPEDRAIVVNGGSFGARFCEICEIHGIPHTQIVCEAGKTLTSEQLAPFDGAGYTAFIVNLCETSTGVLYDIKLISDFCKRNGLFLIVDAVSAFLCDEIDMSSSGADVVVTGSQKALALSPGLSLVCLSPCALRRVERNEVRSLYFDFKAYLKDGERGQTPFTPAVGILLQLNARLVSIEENGGVRAELARTADKANYFREKVKSLPVGFFADRMSNSVTALTANKSAYSIFERLMQKGIWVCPNGGALRDKVFRVGHMGALSRSDYDRLIAALGDEL